MVMCSVYVHVEHVVVTAPDRLCLRWIAGHEIMTTLRRYALASLPLLLLLALPVLCRDATVLNSAGQSLQDIHGTASVAAGAVAASTPTRVTNPLLALMEPALPALKYFLPLVALLALPDLLRGLGFGAFNTFGANARGRRSAPPMTGEGFVEGAQQMLTLMSRVDEALLRYHKIEEGPCRLRALCELHQKGLGPQLGAVAKNLVNVLRMQTRTRRAGMPEETRTVVRDFLKAAEYGLDHKNCTKIYADCPDLST
ncbi:uncharacterized protein LOC135367221 isoform X2 [Ornithodoros turicata]|uniref:uncharacterized protein LOC135367221 isoform X2 n=1 Tax=Ornithodoros turicata TaxID=34597 RepID=UPI0031398EE4